MMKRSTQFHDLSSSILLAKENDERVFKIQNQLLLPSNDVDGRIARQK